MTLFMAKTNTKNQCNRLYNIKGILEKITFSWMKKAYRQTKIEGFVTLAKVPTKGFSLN